MSKKLFTPFQLGQLQLKNRLVMSPMTRSRCPQGAPTELTAEYYAQRADAGLIISEAARVSQQGTGYISTPGIYNTEQIDAWRKVTHAVHEAGAKMFCQLWHVGRMSHEIFQPEGEAPVGPSAIRAPAQVFGPEGPLDTSTPRALSTEEIPEVVDQFRVAATSAKQADFDGVEIHAGNGYLIHQFMSQDANQRQDEYGGSLENRLRLLMEIVEAVATVWPRELISVRLGPQLPLPGITDNDSWELYAAVAQSLNGKVGLLHITEMLGEHPLVPPNATADERWAPKLKQIFDGPVIINGGLTGETAETALQEYADLTAFGIAYLANPDLATRIRLGADLNKPHQATFYGGDEAGYTDYPTWQQTLASKLRENTDNFVRKMPAEQLRQMQTVMQRVLESGIEKNALKVGDKAPDFELNDPNGDPISLSGLLQSGAVVLSFYRGGWCPYCNLELRALHEIMPELQAAGGQLVALTPELPDFAADTREQQEVDFPVLSDLGNKVARQFGLVHQVDSELQQMYKQFGIDLEARNGNTKSELPIPATYVIDSTGVIQFAYADADHSKRAEPHDVLAALKALSATAQVV